MCLSDGEYTTCKFAYWIVDAEHYQGQYTPWYASTVSNEYQDSDSDSDSDKVYSTKMDTSTISGLHEFLKKNTNDSIVLIYKLS